jgi:hypothetical protein
MELLGDMGQVDGRFDSFGDGVNLSKIGAHIVLNVPWVWKSFWAYSMEVQANVGQMEAHFGPFGGSVILDTR